MKKKNIDNFLEIIKEYRCISFDIFDTLIRRECGSPKNLFKIMEHRLKEEKSNIEDFYSNRINSEKQARLEGSREIKLDDIYRYMQQVYSVEQCTFLKNMECTLEIELSRPDLFMQEVFFKCIEDNKHIILTSDMYLPPNIIEKVLEHSGYKGFKQVYLSCELMLTKHSGEIFDYIIRNEEISKNEIIHIGDNFKSDYLRPMIKGIKALLIENETNNLIQNDNKFTEPCLISECNILNSFIDNNCNRFYNIFYQIGYESLGPLLYGFNKWLVNKCQEDKCNKIFFLSRDGQLLKKVYNLTSHNQLENVYMYASRRALIVPTLWQRQTLQEVVESMFFPRYGTIDSFFIKVGLNPQRYIQLIEKYGYELTKVYNLNLVFKEEKFNNLFKKIKGDIDRNSKIEFNNYIQYLKGIEFKGNVGIVDIGWNGNMQKALHNICKCANIDVNIHGYYFGVNPHVVDLVNYGYFNGYLFEKDFNESFFEIEKNFNTIFELFLIADHGSTIRISIDNNKISPILNKFEYDNHDKEYNNIKDIQRGALDFVKSIYNSRLTAVNFNPLVYFHNLCLMGCYPDLKITNVLGNLMVLDDSVSYLAKPKSFGFYIFHPCKLINDFKLASWRIGFLKALFKINLPYYDIYSFIRRVLLKSFK